MVVTKRYRRPTLIPGELYSFEVKNKNDWMVSLLSFFDIDRSEEQISRGFLTPVSIVLGAPALYMSKGMEIADGGGFVTHTWLIQSINYGMVEAFCYDSNLKDFIITHHKSIT